MIRLPIAGSSVLLRLSFMAVLSPLLTGCGGGMNADSMRSLAIQRSADPEDEEEDPAPADPAPSDGDAADVELTDSVAAEASTVDTPNSNANPPASTSPQPTVASAVAVNPVAASTVEMPQAELPTTLEGRLRRTVSNMERIAGALEAYREKNGEYPRVAILDRTETPLLSWRVELLPYLGYQELYDAFDKTKPWFAPTNKDLLSKIPPEYQSPDRGGTKTHYLVPTGGSQIFQTKRTLRVGRIEDGLDNTVMLLEVDDARAAEWTQPQEYEVDGSMPRQDLGQLRNGNVMVAWGGGLVGAVSMTSPEEAFKAIFSADGGEAYTAASVNRPIDFATLASSTSQPSATAPHGATSSTFASSNTSSAATAIHRSALQPTNGLGAKYLKVAKAAREQDRVSDAWQWLYAALLTGAAPPAEFEWYPALRRPAVGLHYGVSVVSDNLANVRDVRRGDGDTVSWNDIARAAAPYSEPLMATIVQRTTDSSLGRLLPLDAEQGKDSSKNSTPVELTFLLPGREAQLRADATELGCDILILFEVDHNTQRTHRAVRLKVFDLAGRREILSSRALTYSPMQADRGETADSEGLKELKWELQDLIDDGLSPKPWPVQLTKRIAQSRVASLGESRDPYLPRVIAEILHYRQQNLVDSAEVLDAMEALLGDERAAEVLLGSDAKRRRALREWLPNNDPDELIAQTQRRRQNEDDD